MIHELRKTFQNVTATIRQTHEDISCLVDKRNKTTSTENNKQTQTLQLTINSTVLTNDVL